MPNKVVLSILVTLLFVSACAKKAPPPIMTDEKFDTRINDQGQTEFAYGLSWRGTSNESLLRDGRQEIKRPRKEDRFLVDGANRFGIQANKQTKLDLEDQAAEGLKKRITKEKACENGYEISKVVWKADNLRLIGYCL